MEDRQVMESQTQAVYGKTCTGYSGVEFFTKCSGVVFLFQNIESCIQETAQGYPEKQAVFRF